MKYIPTLLLSAALLSFASIGAMAYTPVKAASIAKATKMNVHIGSGEKALNVDITDQDAISGVIAFINSHVDTWKPVEGSPPPAEVNLTFYNGASPVGTFGSDATYFTRGNPATLTQTASAKDIKAFLELANIDPEKLHNQPHD